MKVLASALLLVTVAVSPAFAQAYSSGYGTGNIAPDPSHPGQQFEYRPTYPAVTHRHVYNGDGYRAYGKAQDWKHQSHG